LNRVIAMRSGRSAFWILAILTFVYALIFPLLTIDSLLLIVGEIETYERRNVLVILFLELSRLFTTLVGVGVAGYLLVRASDRPAGRALALFLLFVTITYEKALGGSAVPGPGQEADAGALLGAGVPAYVMRWLFGEQIWTAWPAIAALLRFSSHYPADLHVDALEASGTEDRRGFLRGSSVAGADIGASFRALSRWLLARNAFSALALTVAAVVMIVLHTMFSERIHPLALWAVALFALFIAVTNVRGGYMAADAGARARAAWITLGLVLGLFMFLISTAAFVLIADPITRGLTFGLMMLVPAVVMSCLAMSVITSGRRDARVLVHSAVRAGFIAFAMLLLLALVYGVGRWFSDHFGVSPAIAALAAVAVCAFAYVPVSQVADRLRVRILEQDKAVK
jgi:hypothetical protein